MRENLMSVRAAMLLLFVCLWMWLPVPLVLGARFVTPNFIVETANPREAETLAKAAERYRKDLAISWLGQELPVWSRPCAIIANVGREFPCCGETSFVFYRGEVYGWRTKLQGSIERVLDSVLPHEILHMLLATYFRRPIPRWADEGAATSCEADCEKDKQRDMLKRFLRTGREISFSKMIGMMEYPDDVMPLYAQGFSLAEYLILKGGRRKFILFLEDGLRERRWKKEIKKHYGFDGLSHMKNAWLEWVWHDSSTAGMTVQTQ